MTRGASGGRPAFQGSGAQAPSPSFTEGTYAVSELFHRTERPVEPDCDAGGAADRRRAPARCLCAVAAFAAGGTLARSESDRAMGGRMRPRAADRGRLQGRTRNEPMDGRPIARQWLRRAPIGRRLRGLGGGRIAFCRQSRARPHRAEAAEPVGDAAAAEARPRRLPVADPPLPRQRKPASCSSIQPRCWMSRTKAAPCRSTSRTSN